jgi:hypothetical protein
MLLRYKIENLYWKINEYLFPRQKWLIKKIPNSWIDKDTLWEICVIDGLKHYVEQDYGLGYEPGDYEHSQNDPTYPECQKRLDKKVKKYYDLATIVLPTYEKALKVAWKKIPPFDIKDLGTRKIDYDATYGDIDRLEQKISDLKTDIMLFCIRYRESLWT